MKDEKFKQIIDRVTNGCDCFLCIGNPENMDNGEEVNIIPLEKVEVLELLGEVMDLEK